MPFQIKDFVSISASMINYTKATQDKLTDFNVGSVARTMLEAPAIEIEELYQRMLYGLLDAIPTATYLSFGFDVLPAVRAYGHAVVMALDPLAEAMDIPAGTEFFAADGRKYLSDEAVSWPAGEVSVRVLVRAAEAGTSGNAGAGSVTSSPLFPSSSFVVSNDTISTGRDVESEDERRVRFGEYIASLSRGPEESLRYAAKQARVDDEYVTRVGYAEGGGRVQLHIRSSRGMPSAALLQHAQRVIDGYRDPETGVRVPGYRAAGVRCDVLPMTERVVDLAVQVGMLPGFDLSADSINDLQDAFTDVVGAVESGGLLLVDEVVAGLLAVSGVRRVVPQLDENLRCADSEVLIPGTLTVEALNA